MAQFIISYSLPIFSELQFVNARLIFIFISTRVAFLTLNKGLQVCYFLLSGMLFYDYLCLSSFSVSISVIFAFIHLFSFVHLFLTLFLLTFDVNCSLQFGCMLFIDLILRFSIGAFYSLL